MFNVPPVEIGAISAALIAALVSLIGLIISKEQKTSEFRQAWVDALRNDLSNYLTQINAISDGVSVPYESALKKIEALAPTFKEINKATFNISLRLNREEPLAQDIIENMGRLHTLTLDQSTISPEKIRPIERELQISAQKLLKSEWERVKRGEPTFVVAKFAALAVVLLSIVVGGWQLVSYRVAPAMVPQASAGASKAAGQSGAGRPESSMQMRDPASAEANLKRPGGGS